MGIIGIGQKLIGLEGLDGFVDDLLVMLVLGTIGSGSLNSTAVAGIVLGARNVPSSAFEKIDSTTAPGIPATNAATSASTTAFWGKNIKRTIIKTNINQCLQSTTILHQKKSREKTK